MRSLRLLILALALSSPLAAWAVQPDEILPDPVLEARARVLSKELRCMVCQNQSIDDSEAPLAKDLRVLVRERLKAGDSDPQVLDFLVARYGEFVLLNPRFNWHTALLWLGPPAVLLGGALALLPLPGGGAPQRRTHPLPRCRRSPLRRRCSWNISSRTAKAEPKYSIQLFDIACVITTQRPYKTLIPPTGRCKAHTPIFSSSSGASGRLQTPIGKDGD